MSGWVKRKTKLRKRGKKGNGSADPRSSAPDGPVVSICIPSDDHMHAAFTMSLVHLLLHTLCSGEIVLGGLTVQHVGSSIIPHSRYNLAKKSLAQGATHLLYIDSDMMFPAETLTRMLRHDKDIVGINAMSRRPPYNTTAWAAPGKPIVTAQESTGLERAWRTGFALVLLKASVFERLAPPYFGISYVPETDEFRGEDYYFFDGARDAGLELWIDQDLSKEVQHFGSWAFNPLLKQLEAGAAMVPLTEDREGDSTVAM